MKKYTHAPVNRYESNRSNNPPCPGIKLLASFIPASLLITLSIKSPKILLTNTIVPIATPPTKLPGH